MACTRRQISIYTQGPAPTHTRFCSPSPLSQIPLAMDSRRQGYSIKLKIRFLRGLLLIRKYQSDAFK